MNVDVKLHTILMLREQDPYDTGLHVEEFSKIRSLAISGTDFIGGTYHVYQAYFLSLFWREDSHKIWPETWY